MSKGWDTIELVDIDILQPHPQNSRRGNLEAIQASIKEHGFVGAIVAQKSSNRILIGRHRWQAAQELGYKLVPVMWLDVDNEQALRLLLADNRASDLAGYDEDALLQSLRDIGNLQGTLFDIDALETLAAKVGVATIDPGEFKGDYADAGSESLEARQERAERIANEMKDVVLVMKPDQYNEFLSDVKTLQKRWGMNGVIATVIAAVHRVALEQSDLAMAEDKAARMRTWGQLLSWAVPANDRTRFTEDFS